MTNPGQTASDSKQRYFPRKPVTEAGFKEPVSWLGGRELIASLKGMIIYAIYGETMDPRSWMKGNSFPPSVHADEAGLEQDGDKYWIAETRKQWTWKRERFPWLDEFISRNPISDGEFWFDYIADSGDGQMPVYGVACMCLSDLWLSGSGSDVTFAPEDLNDVTETLLPRGAFLFVGGDTAYHVADYEALHERFQLPFMWALASVRRFLIKKYGKGPKLETEFVRGGIKRSIITNNGDFNADWDGSLSSDEYWDTEPLRPLFGLPGNHDYYDDLDGFNRQFRRPPYAYVEENKKDASRKGTLPLKLPTYARHQEASYTAIKLPFGWTMIGIDSENEKLDFRQRVFFSEILSRWKPKKLIVATPEPTTVFGKACKPDDKTARYARDITSVVGLQQPFLTNGRLVPISSDPTAPVVTPQTADGDYCRLDLSGDTHHYARYWGPAGPSGEAEFASDNYASLVAGGGGAFFDSTDTFIGSAEITKNGKKQKARGAIPPQETFPKGDVATASTSYRIFNLWNIRKGGYVQTIGGIVAAIIAFGFFFLEPVQSLISSRFTKLGDVQSLLASLYLVASLAAMFVSLILMAQLNVALREARYLPGDHSDLASRTKLVPPLALLTGGLAIYWTLFLGSGWTGQRDGFLPNLAPFFRDILFAMQIVCTCLLLAISSQYLTWYTLRFKLIQQTPAGPKEAVESQTTEVGDLERKSDVSFGKKLREFISQLSPGKIPAFAICVFAIAVLVEAAYLFGDRRLWETVADIILGLVALGGFVGIIYLAVSVGAASQSGVRKYVGFGILGLIHAVLQLGTPIVLIYYGSPYLLIPVWLLTVATNGFGLTKAAADFVLGKPDDKKDSELTRRVRRFLTFRVAASLMKTRKPFLFLLAWVLYGAIVLLSPFVLARFAKPHTVCEVIFGWATAQFGSPIGSWIGAVLLLLVAFYVGYRLSCLWFSWYLGASLLFNGHTNEAGGAARIEGFKHILRIKVQPDRLTVHVIGFEYADPELESLKLKLVDKFELRTKSIGSSIPGPVPSPN